ncbi:sugar ABC transporter permease [Isoptericola sp. b441]|uniref:Xylose transport system permease protein XylH n=1 Tax=Actinotalea lenta TaxID=3064654 RepID=A0ABT9D5N6_9CELL|nr:MULTISPECIES: sugar ABC transporter permease [unclassified Isoptericola]MDO8105606.1 sugar ABC transporter permease [Isoptericola sp. b441]MDO8122726.1 sugar ABC transporter permease [Isoptericola sp. b490]
MSVLRTPAGTVRWAGRDLGSWPVLVALAMLWLVFQAANPNFLSADNLVNLALQVAPLGVLTLGVVLVLLVGQIDLSTGAVSGLAAAVVAVGLSQQRWPGWLAVLVAIAVGAVVGAVYGWAFTRLGLPSFVLTLAGLLVTLGVQMRVLGTTGSLNLPFESWLVRFSQQAFLPDWLGYLLAAALTLTYPAIRLVERRRRAAAELPLEPGRDLAVRTALLAVATLLPTWYLQTNRGIGASVALFLLLVLVVDLLLRRTRWGRSVRAVGSNVGSAHRAGFAVRHVYVSAFVACSSLAALGGVMQAGRLAAANQGSGGSDTNLTVIAAAVIGGTSLFGGRGSAWSAPLGMLVVGTISSGLTLLNLDSAPRYIVTGLVLALAVTLDALGRRRAPATGR